MIAAYSDAPNDILESIHMTTWSCKLDPKPGPPLPFLLLLLPSKANLSQCPQSTQKEEKEKNVKVPRLSWKDLQNLRTMHAPPQTGPGQYFLFLSMPRPAYWIVYAFCLQRVCHWEIIVGMIKSRIFVEQTFIYKILSSHSWNGIDDDNLSNISKSAVLYLLPPGCHYEQVPFKS